jgi:hypothetical protein
LTKTFCCSRSLLFHSCSILSFCGHLLDNCCLCISRGYLAVGAIIVVIVGSSPLATVSVSSVVF